MQENIDVGHRHINADPSTTDPSTTDLSTTDPSTTDLSTTDLSTNTMVGVVDEGCKRTYFKRK